MPTVDYDAPRTAVLEPPTESLELLRERRDGYRGDELSEVEMLDDYPPALDAIDDELVAVVVPMLADEFRCERCFLVLYTGLRAAGRPGTDICRDCA